MRRPGCAVGEVPHRVIGQAGDQWARQAALAQIGQRHVVDDVISVAGAQQAEEVQPALAGGGAEPGEVLVADLGADAVRAGVASAGIVDRDPGRRLQPRPQHVAGFGDEAILAGDQQPHHLALGDVDADGAQLRHQPRHRHLALVVLRQHEASQFRPEMAHRAHRQRRDDALPIRRQPAFPPQPKNMRPQHQVLHHEALVALEARARRNRGRDHPVLVDGPPRRLVAAAAARSGCRVGWRLVARLHPARPDVRPALQTLQPGDLCIPRRQLALEVAHPPEQLQQQGLQLRRRQAIKILGYRHRARESEKLRQGNPQNATPPGVLPRLPLYFLQTRPKVCSLHSRPGPSPRRGLSGPQSGAGCFSARRHRPVPCRSARPGLPAPPTPVGSFPRPAGRPPGCGCCHGRSGCGYGDSPNPSSSARRGPWRVTHARSAAAAPTPPSSGGPPRPRRRHWQCGYG